MLAIKSIITPGSPYSFARFMPSEHETISQEQIEAEKACHVYFLLLSDFL